MSRLIKCFLFLAVLVALDHIGPVHRMVGHLDRSMNSGVEAMTGKTAVDIGKSAAESLVRKRLELAIREYRSMHGNDPADLDDLVRDGLLQPGDLKDEWGRSLRVEPGSAGVSVRSAGADGRFHTSDDWTLGA